MTTYVIAKASIKLLVSGWLIGAGVACLIILGMRLMF